MYGDKALKIRVHPPNPRQSAIQTKGNLRSPRQSAILTKGNLRNPRCWQRAKKIAGVGFEPTSSGL